MKKAFTLLEILIVIAIISIVCAIIFPIFKTAKINAYKTQSLSNIKQLGMAWKMYAEDNDEMMMRFWHNDKHWFGDEKSSILNGYVNLKLLKDPGLKFYNIINPNYWTGYGYNGIYLSCCDENYEIKDVNYSEINDPANTAVFSTTAGLFTVNKQENLYPMSLIYPPSYRFPTIHGRFNEKAPILWADLHASIKSISYFHLSNKYKILNLGFIDSDQNNNTDELFDLD